MQSGQSKFELGSRPKANRRWQNTSRGQSCGTRPLRQGKADRLTGTEPLEPPGWRPVRARAVGDAFGHQSSPVACGAELPGYIREAYSASFLTHTSARRSHGARRLAPLQVFEGDRPAISTQPADLDGHRRFVTTGDDERRVDRLGVDPYIETPPDDGVEARICGAEGFSGGERCGRHEDRYEQKGAGKGGRAPGLSTACHACVPLRRSDRPSKAQPRRNPGRGNRCRSRSSGIPIP